MRQFFVTMTHLSAWCLLALLTSASLGWGQEPGKSPATKTASTATPNASQDPQSPKQDEADQEAKAEEKKRKQDRPKFLRIEKDEKGRSLGLQTAITTYHIKSGPHAGTQVDLIGAVHIAHASYFQDLNRRFRQYDALLYELVADPEANVPDPNVEGGTGSPVSAVQGGMKKMLGLQFQLDEIDYNARNFVHADMSPSEFAADMTKRGDSFVAMFTRLMGSGMAAQSSNSGADMKMLAAFFSKNRELAMRQAMAEQFQSMEIQMAGLADASGRSTLVTERNRKAFEVMATEIASGKKKLGIFYGAAHLNDMDERLIRDWQATRGETVWLTAWNLKE